MKVVKLEVASAMKSAASLDLQSVAVLEIPMAGQTAVSSVGKMVFVWVDWLDDWKVEHWANVMVEIVVEWKA